MTPEEKREYHRQYYIANKEKWEYAPEQYQANKARIAKAQAKYQASQKGQESLARRKRRFKEKGGPEKYAKENSAKRIETVRQWVQDHPEQAKSNWKRSRARRLQQIGATQGDPRLCREYEQILTKDPCSYCGQQTPLVVDHIVALRQSGDHTWSNFTRACQSCNSRKRDKSLLRFLLYVAT